MKLTEMIKMLEGIKKLIGNTEVYLSGDSEGNTYGTIDEGSFSFSQIDERVVIYPNEEFCSFEERTEL